jgi:hypothetical protein
MMSSRLRCIFASSLRAGVAFAAAAFALVCCVEYATAQPKRNSDYCKADGRLLLFLIDVTTPYDQDDKNEIVRTTGDILSAASGGDKLIIRTIADSHTHSERLIERCMPHCPEASTTMGRMFYCSDGRLRTETQEVRAAIVNALKERLSKFEELKHSDILRTVYSVTKEERRDGQPLTLYIYSDLIENSDYFASRYLFTYPLPRLIHGVQHYKLVAPLKGAEIYVSGVGRAGTADRRPLKIPELNKLTEFWDAYFRESGAKAVTIGRGLAAKSN